MKAPDDPVFVRRAREFACGLLRHSHRRSWCSPHARRPARTAQRGL